MKEEAGCQGQYVKEINLASRNTLKAEDLILKIVIPKLFKDQITMFPNGSPPISNQKVDCGHWAED